MTLTSQQQREGVLAWLQNRLAKFWYGNAKPAKLNPDRSGFSDCSGVIAAAYASVGISIGDMSYKQAAGGELIAQGSTVAEFKKIEHLLRGGDVVGMALVTGSWNSGADINHVEAWSSPGLSYGHGGLPGEAYGPRLHSIYGRWLLQDARKWVVRRYIDDTPAQATKKEEEEEDMTPDQAAKQDKIFYAVDKLILPALTRMEKRTAVAEKNTAVMKGLVTAQGKAIDQLAGGSPIDMDELKKVAEEAAEKGAREGAAAVGAEDVAELLEIRKIDS